jgi:hypothetical protein
MDNKLYFFILCFAGMAQQAPAAEGLAPHAVVEDVLLGLFD